MAMPVLARESFLAIAGELSSLAIAHFEEVDGGVEPRRRLALDLATLSKMDQLGAMRVYTARAGEAKTLVGYCTWNVEFDVESYGLLIARQGAWYVSPKAPGAGLRLFKFALADLKRAGVKCTFPHHRLQGRGTEARLGAWFRRLGAKPIQLDYSLWIGD